MGIPYYFYSLTQKYNNILANNLPVVPDIYCIDFNGIIHPVAQEVIARTPNTSDIHEKILKALWEKITEYIETTKAKKFIICADGVAPLAKMAQQRKRRYLSVYKNKIDNIKTHWDTNAITPGTQFMDELNSFMKKQIRYSKYDIEFIYSGSDENGEGEHKIFDKLAAENEDANIVIHGLDADLVILSLLSHKKNIYLMRETKDANHLVCNYLNIQKLRKAIIQELTISWDIANVLDMQEHQFQDIYSTICNDLVESYCIACSILGNDFIPHLATVDLKTSGLDKLIKATKYAISNCGLLIKDGAIQHACLSYIFTDLAKSEDTDMHKECEKYIKKQTYETSNPSDMYGIKNRDKVANNIYNNPTKWRHEYYKGLFDSNITLSSSVLFNACENYIQGIYWTYAYYKKSDLDFNWYYPYTYAPSIRDIANHSIANASPIISKTGTYVPSYIQLLIVLPKESKDLMKKEHQKYMTDIYAGLYHMYPEKYKIQTFLKTHLWECNPILPVINLKYIQRILEV